MSATVDKLITRLGFKHSPCQVCGGTQRLVNRDGSGLQRLRTDESTEITATRDGRGLWPTEIGEVCPCPCCASERAVHCSVNNQRS